jgi:membrane protease subunit HflK
MESVLANTNTVMVDVKGSNNMLYLPLDKMIQHQPSIQQPNVPQSTAEQPAQAPVEASPPAVRTSTRGRDVRGR